LNDIEEFHSKIQQIAGDNVKAIFVTSALQRSALNHAKSKKIGVIKYLPDNQVKLLLYFMNLFHNKKA
jgi:chromosome segregation ATPase